MAFKLKNWDAGKVVDAFRELKLEVLDNGSEIATAFGKRQSHYVRLRDSPDPEEQREGETHFENGTILQNDKQRSQLLELVYEKFAGQGDLSASQSRNANAAFRAALIKIGKTECSYNDSLAEKAYLRFLKERGIDDGGDIALNSAEPIQSFLATPAGMESITLTWKRPAKNFEKVVIRNKNNNRQVYSGTAEICELSQLPPGQHEFEAVSVYNGEEDNDTRISISGLSMGEIEEATAQFKGDKVLLQWKNPSQADYAAVFRRKNSRPVIKSDEPIPGDANTKKIFQGKSASYDDSSDLEEGVTYHYLFAAIYGSGHFAVGKESTVTIPKAPDGVDSLTAELTTDGDVVLSWPRVNAGPGLNYYIYRREGGTAPGVEHESERIKICGENRYVDRGVKPGRRYTYSVFTAQGDLWGKTSASSSPLLIVEEIKNFHAQAGDDVVTLSWDEPKSKSAVQIRRSLSPPDSNSGSVISHSGPTSAVDSGVKNGREYHYLISVVHNVPGMGQVISDGVRINAIPEPLPDAASGFDVKSMGSEAHCSWTASAHGKQRVFRSAAEFVRPNLRMSIHELERDVQAASAYEVPVSGAVKAIDTSAAPAAPYYTVFTVSGGHAISGPTVTCAVCPDISALAHKVTRDGVELRWKWPVSCKAVRVGRCLGQAPDSLEDPKAITVLISRNAYESSGMKYLDKMGGAKEGEQFHYRVFAQGYGTTEFFHANAIAADTQTAVIWRKPMSLRYDFQKRKGKKNSLTLRCKIEDEISDFEGFVILANEQRIPQHLSDGEALISFRRDEHEDGPEGLEIPLDRIPSIWKSFYLKLVLINPQQSQRTLIIHPNISNEFDLDGERIERGQVKYGVKWKPSRPKSVVCTSPSCNKEISLDEIMFGDFGADPKDEDAWRSGKRRLAGGFSRPLDEHGRALLRKICGNCHSDLPFSAGTIDSKSIAIIGSKGSGKSTYLISLLHQLKNQVSLDFNASLHAQSQATADGFEEGERILFQRRERLPFTLSASALTYDVVFDGSLWGDSKQRAVTLPFYDTPGDNFSSREEMAKYAPYLKSADAVILNIDPLQDPAVYDMLPDFPTVGEQQSPSTIIDNFAGLLSQEKIDIPVAVVFTKADTLLAGGTGGLIDSNRLWASDRRHRRCFDLELHNDCAGMWMEFAEQYFADSVSKFKTKFSRFAFFGSSATGTPEGAGGKYPFVAPMRVEDPFLWMFYNLGLIPGEHRGIY